MPKQTQDDESGPLLKPQKTSFLTRMRNDFLAGIVVAAPIGITVALVYYFVTNLLAPLDSFVKRVLPNPTNYTNILELIPGFGVLVAIVALILLGALAKNYIGRAFLRFGERLLDSMPLIRTLYGFLKNLFQMALQQSERSFEQMALLEYPRKGVWSLCFVVSTTKGELRHRLENEGADIVNVFLPTTPNPTSGFLLFVARDSLKILDMTVEEGAKTIFSAGLVTPAYVPNKDEKLVCEERDTPEPA